MVRFAVTCAHACASSSSSSCGDIYKKRGEGWYEGVYRYIRERETLRRVGGWIESSGVRVIVRRINLERIDGS